MTADKPKIHGRLYVGGGNVRELYCIVSAIATRCFSSRFAAEHGEIMQAVLVTSGGLAGISGSLWFHRNQRKRAERAVVLMALAGDGPVRMPL